MCDYSLRPWSFSTLNCGIFRSRRELTSLRKRTQIASVGPAPRSCLCVPYGMSSFGLHSTRPPLYGRRSPGR